MTNVLQVFGALVLGGAESRIMDIYRQVDSKECNFDFVSMKAEKQFYEEEIKQLGGTIYKIGFPRDVGTLKNIKELRKCMREKHYDAVHAHTSYHCGVVMLAAWLEHIPVRIAHARTNGSRQKNIVKLLPLIFGRTLIRLFATKKIAISEDAGKFLFGHSNFEVIPNAINTDLYQHFNVNDKISYSVELNIPEDSVIIGHIGRFDAMKNHKFVLDCFSEFIKVHRNAILVLVGKGDLLEETKKYAEKLEIAEYVRFAGERSDVPHLIHFFDVLLFPSIFEGLGGVVIEAQAAGVPVVESDSVPKETDLGLGLVNRISLTASVKYWVETLESAIGNKQFDYAAIKNSFQQSGYDINAVTKKFMEIYRGNI